MFVSSALHFYNGLPVYFWPFVCSPTEDVKQIGRILQKKAQINKEFKKNIWSWNHTFKTKEIATSKILANQFLFAGAGNSLASTQWTLMYACMVFSWLYKCAQKGHFCQCVYVIVWYGTIVLLPQNPWR